MPTPAGNPGRHVVLVGMPGSGKTTIGRLVAESLQRPFLDSDVLISRRFEATGRELARREGVETLHRIELEVVAEALRSDPPAVIAAAASVADHPEVMDMVGDAVVVWLVADPDVLADRQESGEHRRSVGGSELASLASRRGPAYARMAHLVIDTSRVPASKAVRVILALLSH